MGSFVRERREAILMLSAAGAAFAFGCGGSSPTSPTSTSTTGAGTSTTGGTGATNAACSVSPSETLGPYPSLQDLIRSDIRDDRERTPLQLTISVVNVAAGCAPLSNVAVEIWQCDVAGNRGKDGGARTEECVAANRDSGPGIRDWGNRHCRRTRSAERRTPMRG